MWDQFVIKGRVATSLIFALNKVKEKSKTVFKDFFIIIIIISLINTAAGWII